MTATPGGVVAAVLEALQPVDDDADRVLAADVADDPAHGPLPAATGVPRANGLALARQGHPA